MHGKRQHGKGYSCDRCILSRSGAGQGSRAGAADCSVGTARGGTRPANTSWASSASPDDCVRWTVPAGQQSSRTPWWLHPHPQREPGCRLWAAGWSWGRRGRGKGLYPNNVPGIVPSTAGGQHWSAGRAAHRDWRRTGAHLCKRSHPL